jgi:hypothetical protein
MRHKLAKFLDLH